MKRAAFIALVLIGAGYFGPWVNHPGAGLILSADDLAEWIKFLPIYRTGTSGLIRELFYLSIWLTPIGLGLLAGRSKSLTLRLGLLGIAGLLVLTPLPKYPELLGAYREPEFAPTFWITVVALLSASGLGLFGPRMSDRAVGVIWIVIGLATMSIAPLHFVKVASEVEKLYRFSIGWGVIATVLGGLALAVIGLRMLIKKPARL
jgi:hypothetical protein